MASSICGSRAPWHLAASPTIVRYDDPGLADVLPSVGGRLRLSHPHLIVGVCQRPPLYQPGNDIDQLGAT